MKKKILLIANVLIFTLLFSIGLTTSTFAQTSNDLQQGQTIYNELQSGTVKGNQLSNDQFKLLGEFYMSRMAGSSFNVMDQKMDNMMGSNSSDQMYTALGKRLSGFDTNASYPSGVNNMMQDISSNGSSMMGYSQNNSSDSGSMMSGYGWENVYSIAGILIMAAFLVALILAVIWLYKQIKNDSSYMKRNAK